ncbi:MAG: hypothetical protein M0039_10275 [Pseudomonadota bacterium]|nr:hypothetical protein [Pseudomonadota bacterium]
MDRYFFMIRVLELLRRPGFLNRMAAGTLRAIGGFIVLLSLVTFFKVGKVISGLPPSGVLGGVLFLVSDVLAVYAVVHTLIIRARDINKIGGSEFSMFPLVSILLQTFGEVFAAFMGLVALGGGMYVWFTGKGVATVLDPLQALTPVFGDATFLGGMQFMIGGVLLALAVLIVGYALSEVVDLLSETKRRLREADRITEQSVTEPSLRFRSGT